MAFQKLEYLSLYMILCFAILFTVKCKYFKGYFDSKYDKTEPHHTPRPSVGARGNGGRLEAAVEGGRPGRGRGAPGKAGRVERRRREPAPE